MSEFSLIYHYFKHATPRHANTMIGIGDDCAISLIPPNHALVSCVDTLVSGRHFVHHTPAHAIAYKSVAVNLSDLAAMGATPYAILVGLSLPKNMANDAFCRDFAQGLSDICNQFGIELIGGDTTRSAILTISVTALGFIAPKQAITRTGANVGDVICVSGNIGSASYALAAKLQGRTSPLQSALDYPKPQIKLGQTLIGYASAMIDISDGLGQDLKHILTASGVGARLNLENIPSDPNLHTLSHQQKWQHQLNGGDDYELCLTISKENLAKFNQQNPNQIFAIGEITAGNQLALFYDGNQIDFGIKGWQHF